MTLVLLILLALVAGAAAILLLHPDAGYVLINYGPWAVETSLAVLVLGVGIWFLLVYLLLKLLALVIHLPGTVREAVDRRRQDRARQSFEAGLLNLFEGNWQRAEAELVRRAGDHHATHLNYLAAARAAQRQPVPVSVAGSAMITVKIGPGAGAATVLLIGFDAQHTTQIGGGENGGATLREANVVRSFASLGGWTGIPISYTMPKPAGEHMAVLLQQADGTILGAAAD